MSKNSAASTQKFPSLPTKGGGGIGTCLCGCPGVTKSRFVPGHDGLLTGWVLRVENGMSLDAVPAMYRRSVTVELGLRKKAKLTGSHTRVLINAEELAKAPKVRAPRAKVAARKAKVARRKVAAPVVAASSTDVPTVSE